MANILPPLAIEYRDPQTLIADAHNAKAHPQRQIEQICASILRFGFVNPVLVDENLNIIAGHGRVLAALRVGPKTIPTLQISHLSDVERRALMLADNKIAMNGGWDTAKLQAELIVLSAPEIDLSEAAGFETPEVDAILGGADETSHHDPADEVQEPIRSRPATTKPGDLVRLGNHRIYCGDARQPASYETLLGDERADQVFTDPPYNRSVDDIGNKGRIKHPEFAVASGELSREQFETILVKAISAMRAHSRDGAIFMIFMDWRSIELLLAVARNLGLELKNLCVWAKNNGGMGSLYRSEHELVAILKSGSGKHVNNVALGKHGRYRTNVWRYAGATVFSRTRKADLEAHPTVKPIALVVDAIKDCSNRGDIVLDPFGGSGTTLLAAERTARRARLIEIDPYYVDATIARWTKMTGGKAETVPAEREVAR